MVMRRKMKKRLTQSEEFEIMKLVLDKFLWLGFGIMAIGFFNKSKVILKTDAVIRNLLYSIHDFC